AITATATLITMSRSAEAAQDKAFKTHWRYHNGHWNYWHEGDRRWYYTDGTNWFYRDGTAWKVYPFDRQFGREAFERGTYVVPGEGVKVLVPRHEVYRP